MHNNCRFCRIILQILVIFAKSISWNCCISPIITNLHAECTKIHYCKCCALRGSLNLMAPNFELCCLSLPQFYRKSHDTFNCLTLDSSYVNFGKFCSFRNDICIFLILNPKKQTEQRFYESFGAQGFRLELKVLKGRRGHLHIHRLSFCL